MTPIIDPATAQSPVAAAPPMELVCPAGSLPALKAAIDHGADCVYLGFRDATNARNFAGLNFDDVAITTGIDTHMTAAARCWWPSTPTRRRASVELWRRAMDRAADMGWTPSSWPTPA
jgi:collagenase-like PrtC family protease